MSSDLTVLNTHQCFGGKLGFYQHESSACNSSMRFAVYQPPQTNDQPLPVLYFLSGLTCTEENFMVKAGAQRYAAEQGLILVAPDTSPRNTGTPGEDDDWDFGTGAGFYLNATEKPWSQHYRMYDYVVEELPQVMAANFAVKSDRQGIFGHSMGGHGALICALRNPDRYLSLSAYAPIAAPTQCPWGQTSFSRYLGSDTSTWTAYDATELMLANSGWKSDRSILIDQGDADTFLHQQQLLPETFEAACQQVGQPLTLRMQPGYDHGYYFIATFVEDHIRHHAAVLCH
ncbi:S-formylglutathione hydrolase [Vacuolonema iberomarrocanum]|uniref:S-formylglutathione hydrolase n=1 Tax=Vacuolonema iberomarrocanum TaxID=3454632 RepID=UPI003F6DDDC3